jgi:hypothetical protein
MAADSPTSNKGPGTNDTTEYSASRAKQTREHAEERSPDDTKDWRLIPGGAHGAAMDTGMASLDRDTVPSGATDMGLTEYGDLDETSRLPE